LNANRPKYNLAFESISFPFATDVLAHVSTPLRQLAISGRLQRLLLVNISVKMR
jgi:hypothetical protein